MHENEKEYGQKQTLEWWNYEILSKTWKLHYLLRKQKRDHPDYITKVKGWKIFGKQATFHHVIFLLVHTIISSKIWDSGTFSTYSWIWGRLQLFPTGEFFFFVNSEIIFCPNVILLLSLQDKLPFFKPPPTTMNHQQCRQGTPTEVVVLVLCLSTKVIHIYVYAQCVCTV